VAEATGEREERTHTEDMSRERITSAGAQTAVRGEIGLVSIGQERTGSEEQRNGIV